MIEFRLAEEGDVSLLEALISRSVYTLQAKFYSQAQMEGAVGTIFAVDTQLIRDRTYFVAECDGKIIGCGGWSKRKTLYGGDKAKESAEDALIDSETEPARVRAFFVDPDYARRGIGSEIVRRCESALVASGFSQAFIIATLPGEKLFGSLGYKVVKRSAINLLNHETLAVVEMAKTFLV